MTYDSIIVGSGIAGLSAAITLARSGKKVALVTKKKLVSSATNYAQGGIAAVLSKIDSVEKHVNDTLVAGSFHNKKSAVTFMAKESKSAVEWLLNLGVPFATLDGELQLTREGGHSMRRIAYVGDYTGKAIEHTLVMRTKKETNITILSDTHVVELLVKNNRCIGVEVASELDKVSSSLFADSVILASGGAGQVYSHTTNPRISTGDGIAMAKRAGAKISDMEFIQFHPTAFTHKGKTKFLLSEALRGEGAYLRNNRGERFMKKYDSREELAPRDIVARAIYAEEKNGPVYLDLRHLDAGEVHTRFPSLTARLKKYKLDLARDLITISPAAHYLCGGVAVNIHGETTIKNLFAAGEVSCTGVHGANRLASNSLLEAVVFSREITKTIIADKSKRVIETKNTHQKISFLTTKEKKWIKQIRTKLQETMWQYVGVIRTTLELTKALRELDELRKECKMLPESLLKVETNNMIDVSEIITKASLRRKKSLGCHFIR